MKQDILRQIVKLIDNSKADDDKIVLQLKDLVTENRRWNNAETISGRFSELFLDYNSANNQHQFNNIIKSGFDNFDKIFGGFTLGEFIIVGGRPSMGKTQLLLSICKNLSENIPILYFTFDHSISILTKRFISSISNIPINQVLQSNLEYQDKTKSEHLQKYSSKYKLVITDQSNSILDFKEQCLGQIKENKVKVIIVDYLQKMKAIRGENKSQIATITNELRDFAREYGVLIIAASQLNRSVESRGGDKRPCLSNLRGSESIEEDADKVIFIYRPEYYGITTDENGTNTNGIAELILAKNKNGKVGTIRLLRDINFVGLTT